MVEDINAVDLKEVLEYLTQDLNTSYIEKRIKVNQNDWDAVEELSEAIHIISERERKLKAVSSIAAFLIDKNETLRSEHTELHKKIKKYKEKIVFLKEKTETLQKELCSREATIYNNAKLIKDNEEKLNGFMRQNNEKAKENKGDDLESYQDQMLHLENQVTNLKSKTYTDTINNFKDKISKKKVFTEGLKAQLNQAHAEISSLRNEKEQLLLKSNKTGQILTETKGELTKEQQKIYELKNEKDLLFDYVLRLEQKIQILMMLGKIDSSDIKKEEFESDTEIESLQSELEQINSDYSIAHTSSVGITPSHIRSKPCEEFFKLTSQAVILNSPHMEVICTTPVKELYEKAIALNIPFHKWAHWIEKEITSEYLKQFFDKKKVVPGMKKVLRRSKN